MGLGVRTAARKGGEWRVRVSAPRRIGVVPLAQRGGDPPHIKLRLKVYASVGTPQRAQSTTPPQHRAAPKSDRECTRRGPQRLRNRPIASRRAAQVVARALHRRTPPVLPKRGAVERKRADLGRRQGVCPASVEVLRCRRARGCRSVRGSPRRRARETASPRLRWPAGARPRGLLRGAACAAARCGVRARGSQESGR